jgi:hypothetical protein
VADCRRQIAAAEADCLSVAEAASDSRHAEYYNQILWPAASWFAWLNGLGWLNELVVFFRTLLLPGLSVVLPLLVFAGPLVLMILRAQPGERITFSQYLGIIQGALRQAVPSVLGRPRFAGRGGIAELGEQFAHVGASLAMFVASIWNQVSAAQTMRRVAADMRRRAASVRQTAAAVAALGVALGVDMGAEAVGTWPAEDLGLFGVAWNEPERVRRLLATAGHLDMLAAVAGARRTCFPRYGDGIALTDLYHPNIEAGRRVPNSVVMDGSGGRGHHVLLTGPNRGGKSTLLRALGAAVLMSQTVGVVFARRARLPVFGAIITALAPADRLGTMSLFEAEIEFAKTVRERLERGASGPMFLMMDEIFHGTNAHDGVEASQVFLDELYGRAGVYSVVSTHYMELPRRYGGGEGKAQTLCMEASVDPADADRLLYSYRLCPGVNQFSSVREILRERGLLLAPPPRTGAAKTLEAPSKAAR